VSDWSNLADDARSRTGEPGPRCAVETFLNGLDPGAVENVNRVLADETVSTAGIYRAILLLDGDEGWPSMWSIRNHRAGKCRCGR
jgi:hypothetical protein